ncbi:MAG: polyprenyl synthetase family protein [Bacteroidales bacterium]|nr:polyprenyl synthetase family protein [Bacteroidales bacterium]
MFSTDFFSSEINKWLSEIEYPAKPQGLYEPIAYMLSGGGKRLRPTLMCAVCESLGLSFDYIRSQAIGIEMFHNFTLLHDDVMDNADIRHGKPTVHRKWNIPTAILSGDTMLTLASEYMSDCSSEISKDIMDLFNKTAIEIYEGQQYDMNFESRQVVVTDEYLDMIRLKTAVLLGCACKIGAIAAKASPMVQNQFYQYGVKLGMAFQLRDDYLDSFGDPAVFGKQIGGDILNDKKTYLSILAWENAKNEMLKATSITTASEKIENVKELYTALGVDAKCLELISSYTDEAINLLKGIGLSADDMEFFENLALTAVKRNS